MSRDKLLTLSRRLSECEALARELRNHQGITDALHQVQLAIARQLGRIGEPCAPPPPAPEPIAPPLSVIVPARLRAHLRTAGHGEQARLAVASGLSQSLVSKVVHGGRVGLPSLRRLEAALDAAERERRPR